VDLDGVTGRLEEALVQGVGVVVLGHGQVMVVGRVPMLRLRCSS
jgi:hypothetical protein